MMFLELLLVRPSSHHALAIKTILPPRHLAVAVIVAHRKPLKLQTALRVQASRALGKHHVLAISRADISSSVRVGRALDALI